MYTAAKLILSALIIAAVSEVAKRSSLLGALIASLPLTSVLALSWLYIETKDYEKVAALSSDILWLVVPSLAFFAVLPVLLRMKMSFSLSLGIALAVMFLAYGATIALKRMIG